MAGLREAGTEMVWVGFKVLSSPCQLPVYYSCLRHANKYMVPHLPPEALIPAPGVGPASVSFESTLSDSNVQPGWRVTQHTEGVINVAEVG